ncbi:MAG TPA: response regulator [Bryobacteraceae bacterium]|nr:response regulator [Bryobacteraceae bacterium]
MLRIVVVEDNPADAQMFRIALEETGASIEIIPITDGVEALEYFAEDKAGEVLAECDLVVLDLNLPRVSGFEVLEWIKGSDELKLLPVVVMSGSRNAFEIDRCYRAGANSYVCKSTHVDEIFATAVKLVDYWGGCAKLPSRQTIVAKASHSVETVAGADQENS